MDDIRRPQRPIRRDYTFPAHRRPQPHQMPQPIHRPPAQPINHMSVTHSQPAHHQPVEPHHPPTTYHKPPRAKANRKSFTIAAGALLAAAAIFGAGWLLKGTSNSQTIPQNITRQVNFTLYFPSPMPAGYTYMKDTATFQVGQVYYKFASGDKRVTVMEQPMPSKKPDLSLMSGYSLFNSAIGKAAVGDNFGQATAVVLTPTTVITFHSVGSVSQNELKTAINNMKSIGQNPKSS